MRNQIEMYKHRRWLEAVIFGFRKKRNCTIPVAKTKALISFAVTAKVICAFVFAYAKCWFSHEMAHMLWVLIKPIGFYEELTKLIFQLSTYTPHYLVT